MEPSIATKADVRAIVSHRKALGSNPLLSPSEMSRQNIGSRQSSEDPALGNCVNKSKTCPSSSACPDPVPTNGPAGVPSRRSVPEEEIDFAELEGKTLVEAIEDPNNAASSLFAVYKNGTVQYAVTVDRGDRVLVPVPREQGIFKHVRLPRGAHPCSSPAELLGGIAALILACVDLSMSDVSLIAAFVVSTWFIEDLAVAPYLALVGPPRSGKTTLLQVLNLVCRRPLLTADITSAAFYEVYEKLSPTLLVDETLTAGSRRELFHLLKTGTTRGAVTLRKGRSLKAFGPKVISCTELPNDAALNSRCVIIPMQESNRTDLAKPTDKKKLDIADALQKQLLQYRLENYHSLRLPKVEGDERLYSRTRDLYQALALPIGNQADFCEYLIHLFETQQEINREPLMPASIAILRFLYEWIHLHLTDGKCAQKELTFGVNLSLEWLQESFRLNAHAVGRALTSLGFTNRKRTNAGFVLWLDQGTRRRIHHSAHAYAIDQESQFQEEGFGTGCELCNKAPKTHSTEKKGNSGIESKQE
jgi:hypothetical protein